MRHREIEEKTERRNEGAEDATVSQQHRSSEQRNEGSREETWGWNKYLDRNTRGQSQTRQSVFHFMRVFSNSGTVSAANLWLFGLSEI